MFKILGMMFIGAGIGYLLRKRRWTGKLSTGISITIALLLFIMGCELGAAEGVTDDILNIGWQGMLIGLAGTLGSVLAAMAAYRIFFRKKTEGDEK